jgi:serine/threonine protein kinase
MSITPGKLLGSYRMLDVVGEGSFGQVWKARKAGALQTVAIKLIPKSGKKEREIQGLRQEIDILKTLRHQNIIQMLDAFETPSDFCVVTEFAQGELFEILEVDTSLSEEVVRTIAKQLVAALHYLHSNRIIHRDMKPQNILIAADGTVKLCDFGFARAMSQDTFVLTSIKGTPLYMAPELVQEQPYTPAVDIWSMGVILYELFVGKPPFYTTSIYKLIKQIVNESPSYPSAMSRSFQDFLQGVLEKDPKKRLGWTELLAHPFISNGDAADDEPRSEASAGGRGSSRSARSAPSGPSGPSSRATRGKDTVVHVDTVMEMAEVAGEAVTPTPFSAAARQPAGSSAAPIAARASPISTTNARTPYKTQEPNFLDPPQFSPQGSPADGPMGSAIADRVPSGHMPPQSPPILALLMDAERRVQRGVEEPSCIVTDPATLEAIMSALNVPSGGRALMAWSKMQETQCVVTLIDKVLSKLPEGVSLQEVEPSGRLTSVLVLLAKTGHICVGTSPKFAAAAAAALRKCNDWVVCLETVSLCSELVSSRGSWPVAIEGCEGIRAWAIRSQCSLLSPNVPEASETSQKSETWAARGTSGSTSSSPDSSGTIKASRGMAQKLVDRIIAKKLPGRICRCIEDYCSSNEGRVAADDKLVVSALRALASILPCVHEGVVGCRCRCLIPFGASTSLDAKGWSSMTPLWGLTARYVFESKEVIQCLIRSLPVSNMLMVMTTRLLRLEPRLGRPLMLGRVPDSVLDRTRRDAAALLGKEVFDSVLSTCSIGDIAFLEQQCGLRLSSAVKREWVPVLSSGAVDLAAASAACGAIASYTSLFRSHWSPAVLYSHLKMLRGHTADVKAICEGEYDGIGGDPRSDAGGRRRAATPSELSFAEGIPTTTYIRDGAFQLASALATLDHKLATASGLVDVALEAVLQHQGHSGGSTQLRLSPAGVASCLKTLQIGVENDGGILERVFAREGLPAALVAFLSREFAERLTEFYGPADRQTPSILRDVHVAAMAILQAPWVHAPMLCCNPDDVTKAFKAQLVEKPGSLAEGRANESQQIYVSLIENVVNILREAGPDDAGGVVGAGEAHTATDGVVPACATVLARLSLIFGDEAVVAFARSGGLDSNVLRNLLGDRNPDDTLGSSLLVVSQLARTATSKSQIGKFLQAGIMPLIPPLLCHSSSSGVRARACNLLGNLCRHSDEAYPSIRELRILPPLINLCDDGDQSTRKFACFAIGNAGFHSDYLYDDLRPAVRTLVGLLQDEEDRTVANAAGALGNLARNSGKLVPEMLACGAVEALLCIIKRSDPTRTAFQIALFSLGNLAAHEESRATLRQLNVEDVMVDIQRDPSMGQAAAKYATRLLAKLAGISGQGNGAKITRQVQQTPYVSSKSRSKVVNE